VSFRGAGLVKPAKDTRSAGLVKPAKDTRSAGLVRPANDMRGASLVRPAIIAVGLVAAGILLGAQAPIVNAVVEHRAVANGLVREMQAISQQGRTVWVGYRVPMGRARGDRLNTSETCCGRCRLEPPTELIVLAKVDRTGVIELRPEPVDCDIDASGMTLVWLDNVRPDESVTWLTTLARDTPARPNRLADRALTALALHASAAAAPVLVDVARNGATAQLKGRALFWLAQRAADQAVPSITDAIDSDPDTEVKKQAVFALSRLPKDEGVPRMIELARTHRNPDVRRQAFFWLGQSKDPRAVEFFASILK
jgi:hypothetical protein